MSKPRYNWWPFALGMIRDFKEMDAKHKSTPLEEIPEGLNRAAIMWRQEERELDAVRQALEQQEKMSNPELRKSIVNHTLISRTYNIDGAALRLNSSPEMVKRYRWQFIMLVGTAFGFLSPEEYETMVRYEYGNLRGK